MADLQPLCEQLAMARAWLQILRVQEAVYGIDVRPHVVIEIRDLHARIADLEAQLRAAGIDPTTVTDADSPSLYPAVPAPTAPLDPEHANLIQRVTNLLDQSEDVFERAVDLDLSLIIMPRLVASIRSLQWGRTTDSRPLDEPVLDLFLRIQRLLIVGAPGAGKSATIRHLCRELLPLAKTGRVPVPVIVNLASYGQRGGPIDVWLTQEGLPASLDISRSVAARLVKGGSVLLLLDGLDEMSTARQAECIKALNTALERGEPWIHWLVVSCRRLDYDAVGIRLAVDAALEIQPINPDALNTALSSVGSTTMGLQTMMDAHPALAELLTTPLAVSLGVRAFNRFTAQSLGPTATIEERQRIVYAFFTRLRFFSHRHHYQYSPLQTLQWLRWLATIMQTRHMMGFPADRLRPLWLIEQGSIRSMRTAVGFIGIVMGILAGLLGMGVVLGGMILVFVGGIVGGLVGGLAGGLQNTLIGSFATTLGHVSGQPPSEIRVLTRYGAIPGGILALTIGLISGSYGQLPSILLVGLLGTLTGCLGVIVQRLLLQGILWQEGRAPLNYLRFLEYCRMLQLLRRHNKQYAFLHIGLRDYFASLTDDEIIRLAGDANG